MWHLEEQCLRSPELVIGQEVLLSYVSFEEGSPMHTFEATIVAFENTPRSIQLAYEHDTLVYCEAACGNLGRTSDTQFTEKCRKLISKFSQKQREHLIWTDSRTLAKMKCLNTLIAELNNEIK